MSVLADGWGYAPPGDLAARTSDIGVLHTQSPRGDPWLALMT